METDLNQVIAIRDETPSEETLQFVYEDDWEDVDDELVTRILTQAFNGFYVSESNLNRLLYELDQDTVEVALADDEGRFIMWTVGAPLIPEDA